MTTEEKIDQMIEVLQAYKKGKQIEVKNKLGEWLDIEEFGSLFNCSGLRIKPKEKVSIPVTEEELMEMQRKVEWYKNKESCKISPIRRQSDTMINIYRNCWKFNPNTKCWEDWSEK